MSFFSELAQLQYQSALMSKLEEEHDLRIVKIIGTDALCVPTTNETVRRVYKLDLQFGWLYRKSNCEWRDVCPIRV